MIVKNSYIKAKIDNTSQYSNSRLCGYNDETIYLIISECSKEVQKN